MFSLRIQGFFTCPSVCLPVSSPQSLSTSEILTHSLMLQFTRGQIFQDKYRYFCFIAFNNFFDWYVLLKKKKSPLKNVPFQGFWFKTNFRSSSNTHLSPNINLSKKSCPLLHSVVLYTVTTQVTVCDF